MVTSWMKRINELTEGYLLEKSLKYGRIWLFFKVLLDKGLVEKGKQEKDGKKSKQRLTVAFLLMQLEKGQPTHCHLEE